MSFHIAESREQARKEAAAGFLRWHNEYTVGTLMRPGGVAFDSAERAFDEHAGLGDRDRHARRLVKRDPRACWRSPAASAP